MVSERLLASALFLGLSSCGYDDAYSRMDTVTTAAGDSQARNSSVHAVDPLAGAGPTPEPGRDGVRAVGVVLAYRLGQIPEPGDAPSDDGAPAE